MKTKTRHQQLVEIDERFIRWLAADEPKDIDKQFVLVYETGDREVFVVGLDSLEEASKHVKENVEDRSGWMPVAIFDVDEAREMEVKVSVSVGFETKRR